MTKIPSRVQKELERKNLNENKFNRKLNKVLKESKKEGSSRYMKVKNTLKEQSRKNPDKFVKNVNKKFKEALGKTNLYTYTETGEVKKIASGSTEDIIDGIKTSSDVEDKSLEKDLINLVRENYNSINDFGTEDGFENVTDDGKGYLVGDDDGNVYFTSMMPIEAVVEHLNEAGVEAI